MTTPLEALDSRKSQEPLPMGTAFQKVQELYNGLNVEAQPFDDTGEEKIANLKDGSRISMAVITGMLNNRALVSIADSKTGISVQCGISANGESSVRLGLPRKQMRVNSVILFEDYADHGMILKPQVGDEERVMSAFVDWVRESLSKGAVTEPPYKLE